MTQFQPLHAFVHIVQDSAEKKTPGGIILAENAQERPNTGTVQSVGPKVMQVVAGQRVVFAKFAGREVEVNDEKLLLVEEKDIIARLAD